MKSSSSILLLIFTLTRIVCGQGVIRGYVEDSSSGEPLPVVNVVVEGQMRGASTNLDGYFVIDDISPGVYNLHLSYLGYHPGTTRVVVTQEVIEPLHIELIPSTIELEEVVVTVEEKDEVEVRLSPTVSNVPVSVSALRQMPAVGGEMDVLRAIQLVPGVKASSDISSALYVRGGSPDQTLILMDHNPVFNPSHMFGLFSTFNADAVKHLELKKGGFPAYYGGRSGSVLEVITNEGNRKQMEGLASLSIISARAQIEGPLPDKKGSYSLAGRRTYMDPILKAIESTDEDLQLPQYYFYDGNGKINLDLTKKTTLTVAGYWGSDHFDFKGGADDNEFNLGLTWGNRTFSSRLRTAVSRNLFWSILGSYSRYQSKFIVENNDVLLDNFYDSFVDYTLKSDIELLGGEKHKFQAGVWVRKYHIHFKEYNEDYTYVNVKENTFNYSAYAQDTWRIHPMFEIQPGARIYYHEAGQHLEVDPRLAMVLHYSPRTRFKLAGGKYSQFINLITFGEGFNNFDVWIPIDDSMDPGYSYQVVAGYEHDPFEDVEFTAEVYYTDMHNLTNFDYLAKNSDEAADAFVDGKGYAYGFEIMLRKKSGRLNGWLGYSLSWTQRQFPGSYINEGDWFYPKWDRRHDFLIVANYALSKRWDLSGTWRYNTGQGFTQAVGLTTARLAGIDPQYWATEGRWIIPGELNNYRFPADHRLDLTLTYKHHLFKLSARLNFSVYNVYSRRSYWMRVYDTNENPVEVVDVKLLPIIPLISYEVRF